MCAYMCLCVSVCLCVFLCVVMFMCITMCLRYVYTCVSVYYMYLCVSVLCVSPCESYVYCCVCIIVRQCVSVLYICVCMCCWGLGGLPDVEGWLLSECWGNRTLALMIRSTGLAPWTVRRVPLARPGQCQWGPCGVSQRHMGAIPVAPQCFPLWCAGAFLAERSPLSPPGSRGRRDAHGCQQVGVGVTPSEEEQQGCGQQPEQGKGCGLG